MEPVDVVMLGCSTARREFRKTAVSVVTGGQGGGGGWRPGMGHCTGHGKATGAQPGRWPQGQREVGGLPGCQGGGSRRPGRWVGPWGEGGGDRVAARGCPLVSSSVLASDSRAGPTMLPEASVAAGRPSSAGVPGGRGHVKRSGLPLEEAEVGVTHSTLN